ncbi:down syndrome cell adhesion molecule-like protein Dscam2 [Trichonephila clavata]|uniref:Down syndrome cell adhesion molecule-like protein Dscam2 n=1 Tax=Trichonephila clavata TaxID=2740835 RepID=A0A8X6G1S9_TRICU|nr:down syndrome cell adhesion molecule-like protein Dscam2 [Trichonephila clavata]
MKIYYNSLQNAFILGDRSSRRLRGPIFVHEPLETVEFSNSTGAVISCSAQGYPEPSIRWERRDGNPVSTIPGIRQIRPDNSLVFFPISTDQYRQDVHAAVYRCIATNRVGSIRSRDVVIKTDCCYATRKAKCIKQEFLKREAL